jgi:hypothetical protein
LTAYIAASAWASRASGDSTSSGPHGAADARADREVLIADGERLSERALQASGDRRDRRLVGDVLDEHDELVAAEARDRVGVANDVVQAPGDRAQQVVADVVAEAVVDRLERVEVDVEERE